MSKRIHRRKTDSEYANKKRPNQDPIYCAARDINRGYQEWLKRRGYTDTDPRLWNNSLRLRSDEE